MNGLNDLWSLLGIAAVMFAVFAGFALLVWAAEGKERGPQ